MYQTEGPIDVRRYQTMFVKKLVKDESAIDIEPVRCRIGYLPRLRKGVSSSG